ncbi:MAG: hypothetical protein V1725_05270 [archaeon]
MKSLLAVGMLCLSSVLFAQDTHELFHQRRKPEPLVYSQLVTGKIYRHGMYEIAGKHVYRLILENDSAGIMIFRDYIPEGDFQRMQYVDSLIGEGDSLAIDLKPCCRSSWRGIRDFNMRDIYSIDDVLRQSYRHE